MNDHALDALPTQGRLIFNSPQKRKGWRISLRVITFRSQLRDHRERLHWPSIVPRTAAQKPPAQERPPPREQLYPLSDAASFSRPFAGELFTSWGAQVLTFSLCGQGFGSAAAGSSQPMTSPGETTTSKSRCSFSPYWWTGNMAVCFFMPLPSQMAHNCWDLSEISCFCNYWLISQGISHPQEQFVNCWQVGICCCLKVLMLPSEDLYPEENNKDDGLSGHLESTAQGGGSQPDAFGVWSWGWTAKRQENGDGTKLGTIPGPLQGGPLLSIANGPESGLSQSSCSKGRWAGGNLWRVMAGGLSCGQRENLHLTVEVSCYCSLPQTGLKASLEQETDLLSLSTASPVPGAR